MFAESSLQLAIQDLGVNQQVPLVADPLAREHCASPDIADPTAPLYIRIGAPLPVTVESAQDRFFVRGNLEKMNWALYEEISGGLRKVIAAQLKVEVETLAMTKLLAVEAGHAKQYVEIAVPPSHGQAFTSVDTQEKVGTYLHVLRGKPLPEGSSDGDSGLAGVIECAREVRQAIGGKTLPATCTITSSGWDTPMHLAGKLGDKPEERPTEPKEEDINCLVDGYIKSQRVVHLLPVSDGSAESPAAKREGRMVVAFDEERWFDDIAALAAKRCQVVRVTYRQVLVGKKKLLQLVDLGAVANPCDDAR